MLGVKVRMQCGSTAARRWRMSLDLGSPSWWIGAGVSSVAGMRGFGVRGSGEIDAAGIQDLWIGFAGCEEDQTAELVVDFDDAVGGAGGVFGEDGFHGLDGGDDLTVGGDVVVCQLAGCFEARRSLAGRAGEFDSGDFSDEALQDFDAVAALGALAPGLQKYAVVVVVDVDFA